MRVTILEHIGYYARDAHQDVREIPENVEYLEVYHNESGVVIKFKRR